MVSSITKKLQKKVKAKEKKQKEEMESYEVHDLLRHSKSHDALDALAKGEGDKDVMSLLSYDEDKPVGAL